MVNVTADVKKAREDAVFRALDHAKSTAQVAEELGLNYHTVRRVIMDLYEKNLVVPTGLAQGGHRLWQQGTVRPMPQFRTPNGQVYTPNEFVKVYLDNPDFQFESAKLTNLLPTVFLQLYGRAYTLADGGFPSKTEYLELRRFLEGLRLQLNNTISIVSQALDTDALWDDEHLPKMLEDSEAIPQETIAEALTRLYNERQAQQQVATT